MRKIIMFNRITIDGYFAGPHGEIDWFVNDPQVDAATHQMMSPDTILFGRITYDQFESFWPHVADNPQFPDGMKKIANELEQMTKIVFSETEQPLTWKNSTLITKDIIKEVQALKEREGGDIVIFGSGSIVQQLANTDLIDEYLFSVTPVVLGEGKPLFKNVKHTDLTLIATKSFDSGNVVLHYKVSRES